MTRNDLTCALVLAIFVSLPAVVQASPPHQNVLDMVRNGEIESPYAMANSVELRENGLFDTPAVDMSSVLDIVNFNSLVLLVDFSDQGSQVIASSYDNLIYGPGNPSVNDYFQETSYFNFFFSTSDLPGTTGWNQMPQTYAYYVNAQNGVGNYPNNSQKMVEDAVAAADAVVNFANYDHDGDGLVDGLVVMHSGTGGEWSGSTNDMWSHAWQTPSAFATNDGVSISSYCTVPEFWTNPGDMTIGVITHELGHSVFGLPDLYDVDYTSLGLGSWSLMSYGSWNGPNGMGGSPAHMDAWCRTQMNFMPPTNVTMDMQGYPVAPIEQLPDLFRVWTQGNTGQEYYLVEQRTFWGYDQFLPGFGILIWHIDESVTTDNRNEWYPGNTNSGHYMVALEQADGLWNLEQNVNFGETWDPWPGGMQNFMFDDFGNPDARDYNGNLTQVGIGNFMTGGPPVIMTDFLVGVPAPHPLANVLIQPNFTPIFIPPNGGSFGYDIYISNNLANPANGQMWFQAWMPTGTLYQVSTSNITLQPGQPLNMFGFSQNVPAMAPPGPYQYIVNIGAFPGFIVSTSHFPFAKQALTVDGTEEVIGWDLSMPEIVSTGPTSTWAVDEEPTMPDEFILMDAYPNPFNAQTSVSFALPEAATVQASLFNTLGQQVMKLADGHFDAGQHKLSVNAADLTSGIYFLQVSSGSNHHSQKLVLIK
jgi:M6 family metalloprotease-like protein